MLSFLFHLNWTKLNEVVDYFCSRPTAREILEVFVSAAHRRNRFSVQIFWFLKSALSVLFLPPRNTSSVYLLDTKCYFVKQFYVKVTFLTGDKLHLKRFPKWREGIQFTLLIRAEPYWFNESIWMQLRWDCKLKNFKWKLL